MSDAAPAAAPSLVIDCQETTPECSGAGRQLYPRSAPFRQADAPGPVAVPDNSPPQHPAGGTAGGTGYERRGASGGRAGGRVGDDRAWSGARFRGPVPLLEPRPAARAPEGCDPRSTRPPQRHPPACRSPWTPRPHALARRRSTPPCRHNVPVWPASPICPPPVRDRPDRQRSPLSASGTAVRRGATCPHACLP